MSKGKRTDASQLEAWMKRAKGEPKRQKTWKYVGRFLWSFAMIEVVVDSIFEWMFNLNSFTFSLLQTRIKLAEKVRFIEKGFEYLARLAEDDVSEGEDLYDNQKQLVQKYKKYITELQKVKKYNSIRNAIAHSGFDHEDASTSHEGIRYKAGVRFENPAGEMPDPFNRKKPALAKLMKKNSRLRKKLKAGLLNEMVDESTITYAEFDEYHDDMSKLVSYLHEFEFDPANQGIVRLSQNEDFVKDVTKIIAVSDNVLPFIRPSPDN